MKITQLGLYLLCFMSSQAFALPGIPEPGLIFYGRVTSTGANTSLPISSLSWSITEPGTGRIVQLSLGNGVEIVSHNSESWFVARVPFQTTVVSGISFDPLPSDTFALSGTSISYNRSAVTVNGTVASIKAPASATTSLPELGVSPTTHAKLERVDLEISVSNQALYDTWIASYFPSGDPRGQLNQDPDKDGISNLMERALGLHPNQPSVVPVSKGTISVSGQTYFTFTYWQAANTPDAPVVPEFSTNMQSWTSGPGAFVEVSNDLIGDGRRITVRSTSPMINQSKAFIRLKAVSARP